MTKQPIAAIPLDYIFDFVKATLSEALELEAAGESDKANLAIYGAFGIKMLLGSVEEFAGPFSPTDEAQYRHLCEVFSAQDNGPHPDSKDMVQ